MSWTTTLGTSGCCTLSEARAVEPSNLWHQPLDHRDPRVSVSHMHEIGRYSRASESARDPRELFSERRSKVVEVVELQGERHGCSGLPLRVRSVVHLELPLPSARGRTRTTSRLRFRDRGTLAHEPQGQDARGQSTAGRYAPQRATGTAWDSTRAGASKTHLDWTHAQAPQTRPSKPHPPTHPKRRVSR